MSLRRVVENYRTYWLGSNCPSVTNLRNLESSPRPQQNVLFGHSNILENDLSMTTYPQLKFTFYFN